MRRNVVAFVVLCAVCIVAGVGYAAFAGRRVATGDSSVAATGDGSTVTEINAEPHVIFTSTAVNGDFGKVEVADLTSLDRSVVSNLSCERVDFSADRGVCLHADRGAVTTYATIIFDRDFNQLYTISLPGLPSRARVSPDGRYGATTTFVYGDSYAADIFSTRTELLDLHTGESLGDLEQFTVMRDGEKTENVDHNFWGVTFGQDSNLFYATLRTGGHTYLVRGDVAARTVTVLRGDVECPSVSPDGKHIAYKKRVDAGFGQPVEWRLSVLDVDTLVDHPLAETRNVDDQAEWLDNQTVLYSIPRAAAGTPTKDTWSVPADGTGSPSEYLAGAYSTGVVRG